MKIIKLLFLLAVITTVSSCTKNSDLSSPNPLENTKWKHKYSGFMYNDHHKYIDKSDFINAMFNNGPNTKIDKTEFSFNSSKDSNSKRFFKFDSSNSSTGIGSFSFHDNDNCFVENEEYSYNELLLYNHFTNGVKLPYSDSNNHPYKLAFNINKPNLLYVYYIWRDVYNHSANQLNDKAIDWRFDVYELTEETIPPPCPKPISEQLIGTWDVDISFDNILQSKGKIIIEKLNPINLPFYNINYFKIEGKFQEELNGKIIEYNFSNENSTFWPSYSNGLSFKASNGTDTYVFFATFNADGKIKGTRGDDSVELNDDIYGNFEATKK